jgi:hypothetical protein
MHREIISKVDDAQKKAIGEHEEALQDGHGLRSDYCRGVLRGMRIVREILTVLETSDKGISENARLHNDACDSERKISVVVAHCEHPVVAHDRDDGATCSKCGKDLGWFCHISPKHYCEYTDDELCIHCGTPEERQ